MIRIDMPLSNSYEIVISEGIISNASEEIKKVYSGRELFIITDERVGDLYLDSFIKGLPDFSCHSIVIEGYEKAKSFSEYQNVVSSLIKMGIRRGQMLVALGGGVIGDLVGFISGTLYRGVPYIQIPTTLLAQTDSSIGGKTAINIPEGKNLIGVFNQPKLVLIDLNTLKTLPVREYNCGLAELIKHGMIRNKSIVERVGLKKEIDEQILYDSIMVKKEIVLNDEFDRGERMLLNFGHTFGHAIEKGGNFSKYNHGEAVAQGMVMALKLGEYLGVTKEGLALEFENLLIKLGFEIYEMKLEKYLPFLYLDKKNIDGVLNFVFVKEIGNSFIYSVKEKDIVKLVGEDYEN